MSITNISVDSTFNMSSIKNIQNPLTDAFFVYNIYLYSTIALGCIGNGVVLFVFFRFPPKISTNWFIFFITLCDFMTSAFTTPVYAVFSNGLWQSAGTEWVCKLHRFASQVLVISSTVLVAGIAFDRYLKVCRPHADKVTSKKAKLISFLMLVIITAVSGPCFQLFGLVNGTCSPLRGGYLYIYYWVVLCIFLVATVIVVVASYKVYKTINSIKTKYMCYNHTVNLAIESATNIDSSHQAVESATDVNNSHQIGLTVINTVKSGKQLLQAKETNIDHGTEIKQDVLSLSKKKSSNEEIFTLSNSKSFVGEGSEQGLSKKNTMFINTCTSNSNAEQDHPSDSIEQTPDATIKHTIPQRNDLTCRWIKRNDKVSRIVFFVCFVFVISWIPPWLCFLLPQLPFWDWTYTPFIIFSMFGSMTHLINTVANPFLYVFLSRKFRQQTRQAFKCTT